MQIKKINEKYEYLAEVQHLYEISFPENERREFYDLVAEDSEGMEFYVFYEEETLIGMLSLLSYKDITHIMYLAVDEKFQDKGYGSRILGKLGEMKSEQRIIADLERITDHSPNNEQRRRRNEFYIRNGYTPSGVKYSWRNEDYELYINKGTFTQKEYSAFWKHFAKNSVKKKLNQRTIKKCFLNALGGAILAFGMYNVHSISNITEGGILGLTMLLLHHFGISPAVSGFVMNFLCYALGLKILGISFIFYSAIASGSFSLFYCIAEQFAPVFPAIGGYPLIAATLGAVFVGVGIGISVRAGGAPGGDDAFAMSVSHISGIKIQWAYLFSDLSVLLLSLTYIPMSKLIYSLYTVILSGQIIGLFQKK